MKKEEYITLLKKITDGTREESQNAYQEIFAAATADFCPPFDRENLLLLAFDLYICTLFKKANEKAHARLSSVIASLADIGTKNYSLPDFLSLAETCLNTGRKSTEYAEAYLSCIRSLIMLIGNRL